MQRVETKYDELIEQLRVAAEPGRPVPAAFEPYVSKVRERAYTVVDRDVEQLIGRAVAAAAISEDEAQLILRSRIDRADLHRLAEHEGVAYHTLKVRRLRAEKRLLLFLGNPVVTFRGSKGLLSSARVMGAGLTGSAGRGAATATSRRR